MLLRMSKLFLRTLREDPADAEVPSHRLLVRAGYIRRAAPGIYTWLPLGWIVFRNVERIVREEMDRAGFQEVHFPALLPREPYEATGRWTEYGDNIFRLKDRKGNDLLLGPTHEEMFTLLVKDLYSSYKDLPLSIYQIQTKYRDEARPRAGLLRGREFVMKDSYSFDVDDAGLERSYEAHREAYIRTFDRLGLSYVIVSAMSGAMGGSESEEFLQPTEVGEDTFVRCVNGDYAANVEAVVTPVPPARDWDGTPAGTRRGHPRHPDDRHPGRPGQRAVPARGPAPWTAADTLKNVVVTLVHPDGTREPLVVGVPGRPRGRPEAARSGRGAGRGRAVDEADFDRHPLAGQGLHRTGRARREEPDRDPLPARPPRRARHARGSPAPTSRAAMSSTSSPAATSRPTAPSRRPRSGTATPAPSTEAGWRRPAASRSVTSSSSAASTPRRWACRCSTRTASWSRSRWAPTASASAGAVAAIAEATLRRPGPVLAARGRPRRRARGRHRQGRRGVRRRRPCRRRARGRRRPGALRRPAAGLAGGEVQGRRAARRPDDPRGRQGSRRRDRSRSGTAAPAIARRSRSARRSHV